MNDKFLYQLREEPDREFAENLRQKLIQSSSTSLEQGTNTESFNRQFFSANRKVLALLTLSLALALMLIVSPTARAAVIDAIKTITIKGISIWVSDDVPEIRGESESYSEVWTPLNPSEISVDYPDFAKLPNWIPLGYQLQDRAALFGSMTQDKPYAVLYEWKEKQGGIIQLKISKNTCPNGQLWESGEPRSDCAYGWYFNSDSENQPEVITINQQQAVLFPSLQILMNLADPIQQWNPYRVKYDNRDSEAYFLIWEANGMRFELATKSWTITKKVLIRLAESVPQ